MHEMGIASAVLEAVRAETRRLPDGHICKVGVRIGELAGVDPGSVRFCFEVLVRGTELEPLELEIAYCPRRCQCRCCGHACAAAREESTCPNCGTTDLEFLGGDELELAYLEVENGARVAGT